MHKRKSNKANREHGVSRRQFLGTTAASGAALLTGGLASFLPNVVSARGNLGRGNPNKGNFDFVEASIQQLQAAMAS